MAKLLFDIISSPAAFKKLFSFARIPFIAIRFIIQ